MQRELIAFFDVDHTISRRATSMAFIKVCIRRGLIKWWYILATPALFVMYRLFSVRMEDIFRMSLPKLRGRTRAEFEDVAHEAFSRYLSHMLYPGALKEIADLKKRGIRVILATSAPFEAVYPLAQHCGVPATDIIATQFAYSRGVFEGRILGVPVFAKNKCGIIRDFAERSGNDLQLCSFYSDSVHDVPLLEVVGFPVAANPDFRLRRVARRRGWAIKDFSK